MIYIRGFDSIGRIFMWLLAVLQKVFRNYGVSIIVMTILVRVAMHPLSRKSQTSMFRMQLLQPKMKEMRAKYKNDKNRLNQEMMKLYREEKVNPMGGCLPMVVQLPIMIGLWGALNASVELRQATFSPIPGFDWISDLSAPDALYIFSSPFIVPIFGWKVLSINLLPLLMIGVMIWQQKLTPTSSDPQAQQTQKMMKFMPIFFGLIFYAFPSGLALYFLVSTAIGVAESKYIRKHLDTLGNSAPAAPVAPPPKPWEKRPRKKK